MTDLLRLLLLPLRAPMLLLLLAVSTYLGLHWSQPIERDGLAITTMGSAIWSAECAQALVVVILCCMPDLLVRRFTALLATSRVVTLVATLLVVTVGGLYLLHLEVLSNVLILASAVLLARLDLARIRVVPSPLLLAVLLSLLVVGGATLGHRLSNVWFTPQEVRRPEPAARARPAAPPQRRAPLLGRIHASPRPAERR